MYPATYTYVLYANKSQNYTYRPSLLCTELSTALDSSLPRPLGDGACRFEGREVAMKWTDVQTLPAIVENLVHEEAVYGENA